MNPEARFVWEALEFRTPIILRIVEPLSEDRLRWCPPSDSNSIAWLLWHIAEVEDNWIRDRLYGQPKRCPFGRSVRDATPDQYPSKSALLQYLGEVRALTKQRLEEMTDDAFDRLIHDEHWGTLSVRQLWSGVVTSCAWHGGQIALTKRLIPPDLNGSA